MGTPKWFYDSKGENITGIRKSQDADEYVNMENPIDILFNNKEIYGNIEKNNDNLIDAKYLPKDSKPLALHFTTERIKKQLESYTNDSFYGDPILKAPIALYSKSSITRNRGDIIQIKKSDINSDTNTIVVHNVKGSTLDLSDYAYNIDLLTPFRLRKKGLILFSEHTIKQGYGIIQTTPHSKFYTFKIKTIIWFLKAYDFVFRVPEAHTNRILIGHQYVPRVGINTAYSLHMELETMNYDTSSWVNGKEGNIILSYNECEFVDSIIQNHNDLKNGIKKQPIYQEDFSRVIREHKKFTPPSFSRKT